jgi:hypothetical protein
MRATLLIFATTLTAATAASQPTWMLPPGTRVRVEVPITQTNGSHVGMKIGNVISAARDSLRIRFSDQDSTSTLAWSAINSVDVSRPVSRLQRAEAGTAIGALAGAVVGAVVGAGKADQGQFLDPSVTGAMEGAVYGAIAGGVIGAAAPGERWERVWPAAMFRSASPPATFRATPAPRRPASLRITPTFARPER